MRIMFTGHLTKVVMISPSRVMHLALAGASLMAKQKGGGRWNNTEMTCAADNEINFLELSAAFMGLRAYCADRSNIHVKLNIDNTWS